MVRKRRPIPGLSDSASQFSTAPPEVIARGFRRRIGETLSAAVMPFIKRAARPFLGGETMQDALCVSDRLGDEGLATAFSYWDGGFETLEEMEAINLSAMTAIVAASPASYLSLKPPALRFSVPAARRLASTAAAHGLRLHFDSHGTDVTDLQNAMIEAMMETVGSEHLGTTLPGCQHRSLRDADWAIQKGLNLRIVKGAWPDPADPGRDARTGFLQLIDRVAGRARYVAVASHDLSLCREAIGRLRAVGTSCEVEVLLGMPVRALIHWAQETGVKTRVYVPFGCGFIPNAAGVLRRNPRLALSIAKAQLAQLRAKAP